MAASTNGSEPGQDQALRIERRGAVAIITLDRPQTLNALSVAMRGRLAEAFSGFGRDPSLYAVVLRSAVPGAFSVGGDVREVTALAARDPAAARAALAGELALCWIAECLSKPTVSLIDGRVMGTGVGISLYNTHRVAGPGYRFSMPETQIGYFPDCGVARAFSVMPFGLGRYLGLTGAEVGPADAYALGLVTHCIAAEHYPVIEAALANADPVDPLLDALHREPAPGPLQQQQAQIARFFAVPNLAVTIKRLREAGDADQPFAAATLARLEASSPTALAVTDRLIGKAADMEISEALQQDCRLAFRFVTHPDFREGVRAHVVEKDRRPRWQPARLEDVAGHDLDGFFASLDEAELKLPARHEMQAARV